MSKLIILGSGTAVSSYYASFDFRYPSGYLLQNNNKNYLIDCSEGIRQRLESLKVDYFNIDTIFISHFHPDHFNVETFIQSQMVRNYFAKTKKTLNVYGPPELKQRLINIWDSKHFEGHYVNRLPEFLEVKTFEYEEKKPIAVNNFILTPYKIVHGNMPAFALRFEIKEKIFVYSGDTSKCQGIEEASINADLFVVDANNKVGETNPQHLNASQAGEIAVKNNVKELVLTHLTNFHSSEELIKAVKNTGYSGKITIASDFLPINL